MLALRIFYLIVSIVVVFSFSAIIFGVHFEYSELNKLESRLTSDIRHPQHITYSRYLLRTNLITGYQCILKRDEYTESNQLHDGLKFCEFVKWWEFYK
jgi:hypothetical protein